MTTYFFAVLALLCATLSVKAEVLAVSSGAVDQIANFPSKFVPARRVLVWKPEGYSAEKKYAVLYMHDGQALFDASVTWNQQEWGADEAAASLIKQGKVRDFIIVGIDNSGSMRWAEYFPQKALRWLDDDARQRTVVYTQTQKMRSGKFDPDFFAKVRSDAYLKFLVKELKPYIDTHYAVHSDRRNTYIMGSSMGGLVSMYALSEYPKVFGGAACMSTHWPLYAMENNPVPGAVFKYMETYFPSADGHRIYFDHGDATLDAAYAPLQAEVDKIMLRKGYSDKNWVTRTFPGADHSEKSWRARLDIPLVFLLGK